MSIVYPTLRDVIRIHAEVMVASEFKPAELRDQALLESAITRPQHVAHNDPEGDLIVQAARLASGISQAQAFAKGNKRTAHGVADAFLAANRLDLVGHPVTFACWLIFVAGDMHIEYHDMCVEQMGLDLAAELDGMVTGKHGMSREAGRREVIKRLEAWLRSNVEFRTESHA